MQATLKRLILALALLCLLTMVGGSVMAQQGAALVRFVHAIPGAAAIDVYTDGELTVSNLNSGQLTPHIQMPAGPHTLTVTQAGVTTTLWEQTIELAPDSAQSLIAASTQPLTFQQYQDDLAPLTPGKARFTAIHAIPGGPAIDVILSDGRPVISALEYGQVYGTLDLPVLAYELAVVPTGEAIDAALVPTETYALNSGASYAMLVYGNAQRPQVLLLSTSAFPDGEAGFVRFVHAAPDAPAVDVYLDSTLVAPTLGFGANATEYMAVAPGESEFILREAGTDTTLASGTVGVEAGSYTTVLALAGEDGLATGSLAADVSAINASESVFNVANVLGGDATISLALADGNALTGDVASGGSSTAVVTETEGGATVSVVADGETVDLELPIDGIYGGVYYEVVVVRGAEGPDVLLLEPVSIAQGIASAPGGTSVVAEPTEIPAATEVVAEPTAAAPDAATPAAGEPTAAAPTPIPPAPTATTPADTRPRATVLVDPGSNLQLRQYPSTTALSIGLAPAATVLIVVGRQGEEELFPFETPDPSATPYVDPVTLLEQGQDLNPLNTWLFVEYNTPDGGVIEAWANAFYLSVRTPTNAGIALRSLPTVPANRAGVARDTALTAATPIPTEITATIGGLDEGVNLQIRRTPETTGESLTLVPNGTVLDFLGTNAAGTWAYVRYSEEGEGEVVGWANALYVIDFTFQGQPSSLEDLEARGRLEIISDDQRGRLSGEVTAPQQPTRDPLRNAVVGTVLLNEGANLQFRRDPDNQSESLGLISSGEQVVVTQRNEAGDWVYVTFDDQNGWVASEFLRLTFNDQPYALTSLPIFGATGTAPAPAAGATGTPAIAPTATEVLIPAKIVVDVIGMTVEPGGSGEGLPVLTRDRPVSIIFTTNDLQFTFIKLEDGTVGWVPSYAVLAIE